MKHLRLTEDELKAMLAKSSVRLVQPRPAPPIPVRGPGKKKKNTGRPVGEVWVDKWAGMLAQQIHLAGLESPKREFRFATEIGRNYRADLCWVERKLIVEVDGGCHTIRKRWHDGIIRGQIAQQLGYRILTVLPDQVRSGEALRLVEQALAQ